MKKINGLIRMFGILMISVTMFACSKNSSSTMNTPNSVSIKNFAFSVATLSISAGTQVTWTNNDATTHTVTADDGSFDSGNIAPGGSFSHTFSSMGTVNYHCQIHPMMKAAVAVK
jgi:plastocyanin